MTHLVLKQSTSATEQVNSTCIDDLYYLSTVTGASALDNTSDIWGRINADQSVVSRISVLHSLDDSTPPVPVQSGNTGKWDNLFATATAYAIEFEDPNIVAYLNSIGIGSNGYVTSVQAASATTVSTGANSTITKFNELKYFTGITGSMGGWDGRSSGACYFKNWTALEEADISNFAYLGHSNGYGNEDTFSNCTSLKKITASSNLRKIGHYAFLNCSNLEEITGLSGSIELKRQAFYGCSKLTSDNFSNCDFFVSGSGTASCFGGCSSLTELNFENCALDMSSDCNGMFINCSSLEKVTLGDCVRIGNGWAGYNGNRPHFNNCGRLRTVDIKSLQYVPGGNAANTTFRSCSSMENFIIRSSTVPTIEGGDGNVYMTAFGGDSVTIYVPDSALNDYKTATGWANVASKIKGISEYTPV